jgi:hypothetical protein
MEVPYDAILSGVRLPTTLAFLDECEFEPQGIRIHVPLALGFFVIRTTAYRKPE